MFFRFGIGSIITVRLGPFMYPSVGDLSPDWIPCTTVDRLDRPSFKREPIDRTQTSSRSFYDFQF